MFSWTGIFSGFAFLPDGIMATNLKNLSDFDTLTTPSAKGMRFGVIVAEWNKDITGSLLDGTVQTLKALGANEHDILIETVPGSFELPFGAKLLAETGRVDAVICLGCIIQGDTPHFTYVCEGVTRGVVQLNAIYPLPFIFGVLTTGTLEQARDRAGGKHGNKGDEAAVTAVKMVDLNRRLKSKPVE